LSHEGQLRLGNRAHATVDFDAVAHQHDQRDPLHAVALGERGFAVGVDLDHLDSAGVCVGDPLERG
jgi:hypothetical protein